jgi:hypothetical protein
VLDGKIVERDPAAFPAGGADVGTSNR